jgi:predicted small lipoprotein YifL
VTCRGSRLLLCLSLLAVAFAGCGKKGPPVAPERRLPVPPADVRASIDERTIVVTWTNPGTRFDGSPLKDLTAVKLFRREDGDGAPLKPAMLSSGRVVGYDEIATIRLDSPAAPATVSGRAVQWVDRQGLVFGHRYVYVVTATDSLGRSSPPSERRPITFLAAPKPAGNVQAVPADRRVTLTWDRPTEFVDETPAAAGELRYLVLRGSGSEGGLAPITAQPIAETSYSDSGLDNDTEYRYAVRALRVDARATAAGPATAVVAATPALTTPPGAPADLVAIASPGAVRLAWRASPEPNVAQYAVYRAMGTGAFIRIGTVLAGVTTFVDRDVRPGTTYRYAVTAIDNARRPNESARSAEVAVTGQ